MTFAVPVSGYFHGEDETLHKPISITTPYRSERLSTINADAAGIDVGSQWHVVAVPPQRDPDPVRTFQSFTGDLQRLADWLVACGVKTVAMESTGVYWIPLFEVLEARGLHVCVVNARDVKHVPGRKTDVNDAQWLQRLHTYGLLRASFHPAAVQALWKPVATEEAFEIVRRLFNPISDQAGAEQVCRAFADYYTANSADFPHETQESRYFERLQRAYPIHPEIFERLYEDWSSLDKFQRTRGGLKLMAKVIHRLWKDDNKDLLIVPGSLPLYDADVRNEAIYYLPQGWDPVLERDVDGDRAETADIERDTRFGAVQAARRVARSILSRQRTLDPQPDGARRRAGTHRVRLRPTRPALRRLQRRAAASGRPLALSQ
ncbi:hypothetical protein BN873_490050 [Candidatus Competibacter denitrificans Run_A_D11]|uniref:Transposase IS110-like N-terminal domain-containing protein n=1 Tax=Candidatus Competibacter denitrificans Run_A_D11 TaxID=1400863 RepID=W6M689_9GAMM|nr:hypothetical protein BN873_490050 [Candidatus Competibacter denitrificans Run_A_D11]